MQKAQARTLWPKVVPAAERASCKRGQRNVCGYLAHPQVGKCLEDDETGDGCCGARLSLSVAGASIWTCLVEGSDDSRVREGGGTIFPDLERMG